MADTRAENERAGGGSTSKRPQAACGEAKPSGDRTGGLRRSVPSSFRIGSRRNRGGGVMTKLRVGLLFGGRSVEHEVSVASASSIFRALDPARYEVRLVAIDQSGRWHLPPPALPPQAGIQG